MTNFGLVMKHNIVVERACAKAPRRQLTYALGVMAIAMERINE